MVELSPTLSLSLPVSLPLARPVQSRVRARDGHGGGVPRRGAAHRGRRARRLQRHGFRLRPDGQRQDLHHARRPAVARLRLHGLSGGRGASVAPTCWEPGGTGRAGGRRRAQRSETPAADAEVTVDYVGTLLDGSEFDSSISRGQPATFGLQQVIKGWTEGLQLMNKGSKFKFYIPAELGYGDAGIPQGGIPGNSVLTFEVDLHDFKKCKRWKLFIKCDF